MWVLKFSSLSYAESFENTENLFSQKVQLWQGNLPGKVVIRITLALLKFRIPDDDLNKAHGFSNCHQSIVRRIRG